MLKKLAWLGIIAFVGVIAVKATGFDRYCAPALGKLKAKVEAKIPLEDQISAIKDSIGKLQPDIEAAKTRLAEKRVATSNLRQEVDTRTTKLAEKKAALQVRAEQLAEKDVQFVYYGDRKVPVADAKKRLGDELKSYERDEATLKAREKELTIREEELHTVQEQVEALISAQKQAETEVAQLDNELMTLRLAETRSKYQADDSRLADIKQSIQKVRDRLNVGKEKLNIDATYGTEVMPPISKDQGPDPVEAVRAKFGEKKDAVAGATK